MKMTSGNAMSGKALLIKVTNCTTGFPYCACNTLKILYQLSQDIQKLTAITLALFVLYRNQCLHLHVYTVYWEIFAVKKFLRLSVTAKITCTNFFNNGIP